MEVLQWWPALPQPNLARGVGGVAAAQGPRARWAIPLRGDWCGLFDHWHSDLILLTLRSGRSGSGKAFALKVVDALGSEQYRLKSDGGGLVISGGSQLAVLYGA